MAFSDAALRKLLHGAGGAIARGVAADAVGMSFGIDGLWQLILDLFASAAHLLVLPFEVLWQWLQTAVASAAHLLVLPFEALLHWLQTAVGNAAAGISISFDGLWQFIQGFFANLLATLGNAAHELVAVVPFEALWQWLQTGATVALSALPLIAAALCLAALVWFCLPVLVWFCSFCCQFLFAAGVGIGKALIYFVCCSGRCLHVVAMGFGRALACLLPGFGWCCRCCVAVTMKAPGAAGFLISRAAFVANPQLYFQILRSAGAVVASAVFCTTTVASAVAAPVAAIFRA